MSYSGADDQSEDGELKRSPPISANNPDDLDFSFSDEGADTADSLDIKPPQAKLATRTISRKYDRSRGEDGRHSGSHHSRSDRHGRGESDRHSHRDSEKSRHRSDKYESAKYVRGDYRDKEREYREKEYFLKEQYSSKDIRYIEQMRSRREEMRYAEAAREMRYSESKNVYSEHEKHRKERDIKYIDYEMSEERRQKRESKYYEQLEHEQRRERKEISRRERKEIKSSEEYDEKTAVDRTLEDLRERLLDKRRTKENEEHKMSKSSKKHKSKHENIPVEPGEIVADSKTYVKEIIDLSKSTDEGKRHHRHVEKTKEEMEMSAKEMEEREMRRVKLLEAEREIARQKEKSRQEIEVRRERRERKRLHEEQKLEAKRRKLAQEEEELKLMKVRHAALSDELTGVVTVSDNTDESEVEVHGESEEEEESDRKDDDDEEDEEEEEDEEDDVSGHSRNRTDESEDSEDEEESSPESTRRDRTRDKQSLHTDDEDDDDDEDRRREDLKRSNRRSRTRSRTRSKSISRSRSRSRTRSKSVEEDEEEDDDETKINRDEKAETENSDKNKEEKEPEEELPPYIPAVQGCRSVEEFQCLNRIEEGTYGVVYRARDKRTDEIVALKRLKMEKEKEGFPITSLREINTLLKGQHPNIVTVREIVVGSNMDKIFIVMDYVEHDLKSLMETMRNKKQGFVPGEVKCLLQQLLRAVAHLHDNWILHRDLKTSNLLLSHKGILKVGDFGLAREYGSPLKAYTPIVVTLWYRAPELLLCTKEYSTPIDMWSVGCIFAELLLMNAVFPGKSEVDQLNRIFKDLGTPNEKIWPGYSKLPAVQKVAFSEYPVSQLRTKFSMLSELGLNLLSKFLTYDPAQRVTAEDALKHTYFSETPLPIDPAMFPTWPAKSELGHRKALAASPKPPSGGGQYKKLGDGDDDSALGFHMGSTASSLNENRRLASMGGGFSLKF